MAKQDLILLALPPAPILDLMERALRAAGFDVARAGDEAGLNQSVAEAIPALMIIGERFGGRDGLETARGLLERFPTMPIILYADQDRTGLVKDALKAGLAGYLYPPLHMAGIVEEVEKSLARARKLGDWLRREVKRTTSSLAEKAEISEIERAKLEAIIANIQDGVIVIDQDRRILLVNQTIRDIFRLENLQITGAPLLEALPNADLKNLLVRASEGPLKYHEINFEDGRVYSAQYAIIPNIGAAVTMQDISYLKELDRLKSDFIHTVSHDLRSPLTSVLGYAELLERTGPLNENQREFYQRLHSSIRHIATLVNDLLDLGRLEAGFDTRRESVHLESVLKYALDMFDNQIRQKDIQLTTEISEDVVPIRANPIRIRQMMDNLIGNAIKYTPIEGRIRVGIAMRDGQIVLQVADTGPGVPDNELSHIFEKFYRASNAPETVEGSGLGLSIVKSIVESHQGRVWVESVLGSGATFIVTLPTHD